MLSFKLAVPNEEKSLRVPYFETNQIGLLLSWIARIIAITICVAAVYLRKAFLFIIALSCAPPKSSGPSSLCNVGFSDDARDTSR